MVAACSDSSTPSNGATPGTDAGSSDGDAPRADGAPVTTPDGGTTAPEDSGAVTDASTASDTSTSTGAGLGTANGIVGTFGGVVHAHFESVATVPQQAPTVVLGARSSATFPWATWDIRLKPQLGHQDCVGTINTSDPYIHFGDLADGNAGGTTGQGDAGASGRGECSIDVTSIAPKYEGTFTAKLIGPKGAVQVTSGAFRVPK